MEIKINGCSGFAFLNEKLFVVNYYSEYGWGYRTGNVDEAKAYGFGMIDDNYGIKKLYFLPIKDIAHTRGFESVVCCKYKGYECYVHSYNACDDKLFCLGIHPDLALAMGYNWNQIGHEMLTIKVPLSDLDEIYRKRRKLDKFIFDVDPIKPIYKDGKWLIEPDENGVYVI